MFSKPQQNHNRESSFRNSELSCLSANFWVAGELIVWRLWSAFRESDDQTDHLWVLRVSTWCTKDRHCVGWREVHRVLCVFCTMSCGLVHTMYYMVPYTVPYTALPSCSAYTETCVSPKTLPHSSAECTGLCVHRSVCWGYPESRSQAISGVKCANGWAPIRAMCSNNVVNKRAAFRLSSTVSCAISHLFSCEPCGERKRGSLPGFLPELLSELLLPVSFLWNSQCEYSSRILRKISPTKSSLPMLLQYGNRPVRFKRIPIQIKMVD